MSQAGGPTPSLLARAWQAGLVVLGVAIAARVAWEILKPLVPGLLIGVVVVAMVGLLRPSGRR